MVTGIERDPAAAPRDGIADRHGAGGGGDHPMSTPVEIMRVIVNDRGPELRERLRGRLERAAQLRCREHGQPVIAVTIHGRENGWFDVTWTTCCVDLERQAAAIVKNRC